MRSIVLSAQDVLEDLVCGGIERKQPKSARRINNDPTMRICERWVCFCSMMSAWQS